MAKLPTRDDLGGLPNVRPRSAIPSMRIPNASGVGADMVGFGKGISALGEAALAVNKHDQQVKAFETERAYQEFSWQQDQAAEQAARNIQPGQAVGFAENTVKGYTEAAKDFYKSVPDDLKPTYEEKLYSKERTLFGTAINVERTEQASWTKKGTQDARNNNFVPRSRVIATDELPVVVAEHDRMVDLNPYLSPAEKEEEKRTGRKQIERAHVDALPPDQAVKLLTPKPLVDRIISAESGGNPTARNNATSAAGLGGFIDSTWLSMVKRHRPDLAQGKTDAQIIALKTDPALNDPRDKNNLSRQMTDIYAKENTEVLARAGLPATAGNIYLAHFLGPGGAVKVLRANPNTPVAALVSADAVKVNPKVLGQNRTAADVARWATNAMGPINALDDKERDQLYDRSVIKMDRAEVRAERVEEKERRQAADDILKAAYERAGKGELTPEFLETVKPYIPAATYRTIQKQLQADDNVDDPAALADLVTRIDTTDPVEFTKAATDYMNRGKLKTATFISLSEKNRTASKDDQPASPYRSGYSLVRSTLDPGQMLQGAARSIAENGRAQALVEFDNWASANPRATRAETVNEAQNIIKRYQVIDTSGMKLSIGTSRYFGTKARGEVKMADIGEAETKLFGDIQSGTLTKEQQAFEIRLLEQWRAILEREETAKQQQPQQPAQQRRR